jgi:hypothetical protein
MPSNIISWQDFNYQTLIKSLGKVLQLQVQPLDFSRHFDEVTEFTAEHSLECFLNKWTRTIVSFSLSAAQKQHAQFDETHIRMIQGCDATVPGIDDSTAVRYGTQKSRLLPDWAGIMGNISEGVRPNNMLPGDTKLSYKWESKHIIPGAIHKSDETPKWLWPIMQVLTYCRNSHSRYGYIITDKELVVIRVKELVDMSESFNSESGIDAYDIEFASIKYKSMDTGRSNDQLTFNMALWWLHLLAAKDNSIQQVYGALDQEFSPNRRKRRDTLFQSEIEDDRESFRESERGSTTPPYRRDNSVQASQGQSSFGPFSETESTPEQDFSSKMQRTPKRARGQSKTSDSKSKGKQKRRKTK